MINKLDTLKLELSTEEATSIWQELFEKEITPLKEELDYLRYFYETCDFGPADEDEREAIDNSYQLETGKSLPEGY